MFNLSEEHIQLQQTFREFAENEVKPLAKELDETERFPTETVQVCPSPRSSAAAVWTSSATSWP